MYVCCHVLVVPMYVRMLSCVGGSNVRTYVVMCWWFQCMYVRCDVLVVLKLTQVCLMCHYSSEELPCKANYFLSVIS